MDSRSCYGQVARSQVLGAPRYIQRHRGGHTDHPRAGIVLR